MRRWSWETFLLLSPVAEHVSVTHVVHVAVGRHVDVFAEEVHGSVDEGELRPSDVIAEGTVVTDGFEHVVGAGSPVDRSGGSSIGSDRLVGSGSSDPDRPILNTSRRSRCSAATPSGRSRSGDVGGLADHQRIGSTVGDFGQASSTVAAFIMLVHDPVIAEAASASGLVTAGGIANGLIAEDSGGHGGSWDAVLFGNDLRHCRRGAEIGRDDGFTAGDGVSSSSRIGVDFESSIGSVG